MYPDAKTIVWAHNHHVMRRHSAIDDDPSMGDLMSRELMAETYVLGLYAHSGTGTYPDRTTFPIPDPPTDSVERDGIADGDDARITLLDGVAWADEICITRQWGIEEEILVPREQFDAICVVRDIHPQTILDGELLRRIPM